MLNTQIGFFTEGEWLVEPPFKRDRLEALQVASAEVPGPSGTTTRYLPEIRSWISAEGHAMMGPVFEIYPSAAKRGKSSDLRVEIQIPVRPRSSASVASTGHTDREANAPDSADLPIEAIDALVEAQRFGRIAEQLMPPGTPMRTADQVWLGQVLFRISAIAKGVQPADSDPAKAIASMAEAMLTQYRQVSRKSGADPLADAIVRVDPNTDPLAARKRTIMRALDGLLGRVATKAADAPAALAEVTHLLQEICDLLHGAAPK
jgi:hypothetical protein